MPAKDLYHQVVKTALQKDGWKITHDPLTISAGLKTFHVDLGAEKMIAAEKAGVKIAVEIKSFLGTVFTKDFYNALGQFDSYFVALSLTEPERVLYLAIPLDTFEVEMDNFLVRLILEKAKANLIVYDIENENIAKWIKY
jgi:hypothetical protein